MKRPRGRPFEAGNTLGRGRSKGSRNKEKFLGQRLLEEYGEHILRKCIAQALQGDLRAMRQLIPRLIAARREDAIGMSLPPIRTARDLDQASEKVVHAIRRGKMTPQQGETMMRVLESRSRVLQLVEFEQRLEKLEQGVASQQNTT